MTNYEKICKAIKEMGVKQFAKIFCDYNKDCDECPALPLCTDADYDPRNPYKYAMKWLESEAEKNA